MDLSRKNNGLKTRFYFTLRSHSLLLLAIPMVLAAFTYMWNPVGFPFGPSNDEAIYMRRAMNVLEGLGPQESTLYDHPYFGQLFLAGALGFVGYPHILRPSLGEVQSVEMLWVVPRILIGLLAVMDTFLIYKISSNYYNNKNVALVAAVIFAVMPISLLIRRVWLEPIQLPFILSSILFAVYFKNSKPFSISVSKSGSVFADYTSKMGRTKESKNIKNVMLILFSGIFLGLAIFTKIPALTMIPLISFLIYSNPNRNKRVLKALGLWFIPVILIPSIWPTYNLFTGHFNQWWAGVIQQTHRGVNTFFSGLLYDFKIDSVFVVMAIAGLIFAAIKRDFFLLLWYVPFLIFLYVLGFVSYWHFTPLLPASLRSSCKTNRIPVQ